MNPSLSDISLPFPPKLFRHLLLLVSLCETKLDLRGKKKEKKTHRDFFFIFPILVMKKNLKKI